MEMDQIEKISGKKAGLSVVILLLGLGMWKIRSN
jgi:hypothetical protein